MSEHEHIAILDHLKCQAEDWRLCKDDALRGLWIPHPDPIHYVALSRPMSYAHIWLN